ncbi:prenyltransferase [Corynebacterium uterequi]|uniref:4-hydroxybenzoate polyprenyltransferase-like prenyltransferase n=1 Tax=Corynebacterium uterequi TaxID=1072256 RepID=A0A0G3H9P8_9CORY|nr:prenyltransferase [Corynebacterium uterequi]AKK10054.1 4-hydroxybenzoate polyprenyltransferase-like prenyltransferase [Corynebacterium uterequi]
MTVLKVIVASSRPISWVNTAFPFAAAYLFAGGGLTWQLVVGTVFFLITFNMIVYGVNDVYDYESDIHNPRKGGVEGAVLAPRYHRPVLVAAAAANAPFIVALLLGGTAASAGWLALAVASAVAYSVPGLRFKERPVLDSATSSAHFTTPALVGWTMTGTPATPGFWLAILAFFLWGMASHALGAVQDVQADRAGGLSSIATELGARTTTRAAAVAYAVSALVLLGLPPSAWVLSLAAAGYALNAGRFWNVTDATCEVTRRAWGVFLWLNYVVGFVVTMLLLFA